MTKQSSSERNANDIVNTGKYKVQSDTVNGGTTEVQTSDYVQQVILLFDIVIT